MKRSHELLERELPPRDAFSQKASTPDYVRTSTSRKVEVMLDVPDSTTWRKVVIDGAAPGTPQQNVLIASEQRSKLSLAELALKQYRSGNVVATVADAGRGQR